MSEGALAEDMAPASRHPALAWLRDHAGWIVGLALVAFAVGVLHSEFQQIRFAELRAYMVGVGWPNLLAAIFFTAVSFLALIGYEHCALLFAGRPLPFCQTALAAFVAQSIAHSTGFAAAVGGGLRYQIYSVTGLGLADVAKVQAFFSATFTLGVITLVGAVLLLEPQFVARLVGLPLGLWRFVGLAALLLVAAYLLWAASRPKPLTIRGHTIEPPRPGITLIQIGLAVLDLGAAAAALWILMPPGLEVGYLAILGIFVIAVIGGVISHVPGALGVFESLVLLQISPPGDLAVPVIGALLLYRAVYYFLPLGLGAAILAVLQLRRFMPRSEARLRAAAVWAEPLLPVVCAALSLLVGAVLLFSSVTPPVAERIALIGATLPVTFLEVATFVGSLVGAGLILLALPLRHRLSGAWSAAIILMSVGVVTSLVKGLDWEEASVAAFGVLVLSGTRSAFYRRSRLFAERLTPAWWLAVVAVLGATIWLLFFAYRHVDYAHELWWQFELESDVSRALRAALGAVLLVAGVAVLHLVRRAPAQPTAPDPAELDAARAVVDASGNCEAWLALTGDKCLLFNEAQSGFVMYGASGGSWIAMGAPVGPRDQWPSLIWQFREEADAHGVRTVFYEVDPDDLPPLLELGLAVIKLGERARVPLASFDLKGKRRSDMRTAINKATKLGITFEVVPADGVPPLLDELEAVSAAWLQQHKAREKRFSLGFFSRDYLARTPVAIVRRDGRLVAFANIWPSTPPVGCSLDLMRFLPDAGPGIMDFLITSTILWAKEQGYQWFDLGMAPLSGLADHRLAPLWSRLGRLVVRHGAEFYNFDGLRAFKAKFDPEWRPAYLLFPGGTLPSVLADTAALVSGGLLGVVRK
ncbi:MAG: bifunctional lysylphosphatidylglycerol flippase/synthetase MprF [Geminicoccaceae bacterium]